MRKSEYDQTIDGKFFSLPARNAVMLSSNSAFWKQSKQLISISFLSVFLFFFFFSLWNRRVFSSVLSLPPCSWSTDVAPSSWSFSSTPFFSGLVLYLLCSNSSTTEFYILLFFSVIENRFNSFLDLHFYIYPILGIILLFWGTPLPLTRIFY